MNHPDRTKQEAPPDDIREEVRKKYGAVALKVLSEKPGGCCGGPAATSCGGPDPVTANLYDESEAASVPDAALQASLGCGNPTALALLKPGETVLDRGSGGGIDVLLSAKRVGPAGFAYGLDMTDEMLALAEQNRISAGAQNVKFLKGTIEAIPLPDASVDVIISNCVINLSADKDRVFAEAFRVLKPGGRLAVSDIVVDGELPPAVRASIEAYVGCVAGALERNDYTARLARAGFCEASITPTRAYRLADFEGSAFEADAAKVFRPAGGANLDGRIFSAFIRASKPVSAPWLPSQPERGDVR